jgi:hypothetical protein
VIALLVTDFSFAKLVPEGVSTTTGVLTEAGKKG